MRHEMNKGNFAGVARTGKHALTEESPANPHPVKATNQGLILPALNAMGHATTMQAVIKL
jgi:hypothetical protein